MTRTASKPATKGSQYWLQRHVEEEPAKLQPAGCAPMEWISPRAYDEWAEDRDGTMLRQLGLAHLEQSLATVWPSRGPVWDGLARSGDTVFLVEAKSHIPEFLSSPCAAKSPRSRNMIAHALEATRDQLGADPRYDWMRVFFQYANRLAHLLWLRNLGVDAKLLFVSFVGDAEMKGPSSPETWTAVFLAAEYALGLPVKHPLSKHILHVYSDVRQ